MLKHNFYTAAVTLPHTSRCKQWVGNCHRPDLETKTAEDLHRNFKLCSKHFETSMICQQVSEHFLFLRIWHYLLTTKPVQLICFLVLTRRVVFTSGLTCPPPHTHTNFLTCHHHMFVNVKLNFIHGY